MPNLNKTVTFLFAGDGSLASEGLSAFLQTKSDFMLLSECRDGAGVIADIAAHCPEIAVIDAHLPDMPAAQIIEAVREHNQTTRIIVLGSTPDRNLADQLLALGADAFIVRNGPSRHLNDAIRYVRDGGKYLSPQLTREQPVAAENRSLTNHDEAVSSLRAAVEAQAHTVERLEQAMERTQYAIELLQQKVEQLSGSPIEPPPALQTEATGERKRSPVRTAFGSVAAALAVGVLGFMCGGALRPAPESPIGQFLSAGAEDALKPGVSASLHLAGWESETVANAVSLLKNQQYAAAEKLCRSLLKQNPANTSAMKVLASALFHQNRVEESADVLHAMAAPQPFPIRAR